MAPQLFLRTEFRRGAQFCRELAGSEQTRAVEVSGRVGASGNTREFRARNTAYNASVTQPIQSSSRGATDSGGGIRI